MRREGIEEIREAYYGEESPQSLKDWAFDAMCEDDARLDRDFEELSRTCERWERCVYPLTIVALALAAVSAILHLTAL